jgi:molybdate transport system substrate-binding protein
MTIGHTFDAPAPAQCYARGHREATVVVIERRALIAVLLGLTTLASLATTACGNDEHQLRIFAASSLQDVLPELLDSYADTLDESPTFVTQYGGSQALATQIELGAEVDLFLAANRQQIDRLDAANLVDRAGPFAANRLVIVVPEGSAIDSIEQLAALDVRIALAAPDVPAGALTREALDALDPALAAAILENVATEDPNIRVVLSRVDLGEVNAAFVYATDLPAAMHVRSIELPADLAVPTNQYIAALTTDARPGSDALLDYLTSDEAQAILASAGFEVAE